MRWYFNILHMCMPYIPAKNSPRPPKHEPLNETVTEEEGNMQQEEMRHQRHSLGDNGLWPSGAGKSSLVGLEANHG